MQKAKLFPNGRSQAVRLPKKFQFSGDEVFVNRLGDMVILFPAGSGWDILAESLDHFTEDFMEERGQDKEADKRMVL